MNKEGLIAAVSKDAVLSKKDAGKAVESVLDNIKKGVKKGGVQLIGFGSFNVVTRKARKGRNPRTGEVIKIKASKTVKFKPGKAFKSSI
ncbi:MAG: HU family DNA-binding protein [Candidatus Firestonebacteria bacterium]|nr:HU family DNA-binding protein [Candidatus Firestonebacteria bacterium]